MYHEISPTHRSLVCWMTSSTSLEVEWCFACNFRPQKYKLVCHSPGCQDFRGKIYLCSSCSYFCPICKVRLGQEDLLTASGPLTLETLSSKGKAGKQKGVKGLQEGKGKSQAKGVKARGKSGKGKRWVSTNEVEERLTVPGYAIGTVIGQNSSHLRALRSAFPGLDIQYQKTEWEETFAGQRSHQMEVVIRGSPNEVDEARRRVQMLLNRAGASHKAPHVQNVLIDVPHSSCAKLVPAVLTDFHVCPVQFQQTSISGGLFVLERLADVPEDVGNARGQTYKYCSERFKWQSFLPDFQRCLKETSEEKLSEARVSVRLGKLFFWGRRLSEFSGVPGAIEQLGFKDCRHQFAARLKGIVQEVLVDVLKKNSYVLFQRLLNITYYIKPEDDGEKREVATALNLCGQNSVV